jgi:ferredoxin-nitrite reductase
MTDDFSDEQKRYLEGFAAGSGVGLSLRQLPTWAQTLGVADARKPHDAGDDRDPNRAAQARDLAAGRKLVAEENAKRDIGHGLDVWDRMVEHARDARFPKGTDVFLFKFQGMFYVAPAQDSFMCRLRIAGGVMTSHQLRGVATLAGEFAGGYADITTRANLQLREIKPQHTCDILTGLADLGIINRGSGADNIRNVTSSPTAGIDKQELIDTLPLAKQLHHHILNHRDMYGLPRKFNIAFDGAGTVSALEDTNDIGFTAVRTVEPIDGHAVAFRLTLGGITGHKDFARDTGLLVLPRDAIHVSHAVVRAFIEHGDRTDRKKARLKYVLDRLGFAGFIAEVKKHLKDPSILRDVPLDRCLPRPAFDPSAHVGVHEQKQPGLHYVGVVVPVGRLTCDQMRGVADIADRFGSGTIRLTVWQNLLISDIATGDIDDVRSALVALGLHHAASSFRAGLVACTGAAGCKYANAHTKTHAMRLATHLEQTLGTLDVPINIHLTGCHHSCAQHYIGDIGLIATKVPFTNDAGDEDLAEGYHLFVGGGYGASRGIGRELLKNVTASDLPGRVESLLRGYLVRRDAGESFRDFVLRHDTPDLLNLLNVDDRQAVSA